MLPTPDTSHVPYERVYEPSEDSFLLLDTFSSDSEKAFLRNHFHASGNTTPPLVLEIGTGSGVVISFVHAQAEVLFGSRKIMTAGVDMNPYACRATVATARKAAEDNPTTHGMYLGSSMSDLTSCFRPHEVDMLIFNPPYVPTHEMPVKPEAFREEVPEVGAKDPSFDDDSYLLALSYAGGFDGMETTDRLIPQIPEILSERGVAYLLLCQQNKPAEVKQKIAALEGGWRADMVGSSGKTAGWEKLQVVRIWRDKDSVQ